MALNWAQTRDVLTVGSAAMMAFVAILFGTSLPRLWQQAEDIGAIKTEISTMVDRIGTIETKVGTVEATLADHTLSLARIGNKVDDLDQRLATVETTLSSINSRTGRIEERLAGLDSDPSRLLAAVGLPNEKLFAAVDMGGGQTLVFPRTVEAQQMLARAGFELTEVSPGIAAYKLVATTGPLSVDWLKKLQTQTAPAPIVPH